MSSDGGRVVALGLGSNLGDRWSTISLAAAELKSILRNMRLSSLYETEPQHVTDQPRFLNACCAGRTDLEPRALLELLQDIERSAGRERHERYGPRTLDIDILLYGDAVIDEPGLRVPHPRMAERAFVLIPLGEVMPDWRHPVLGRTIAELASSMSPEGVVLADALTRVDGATPAQRARAVESATPEQGSTPLGCTLRSESDSEGRS